MSQMISEIGNPLRNSYANVGCGVLHDQGSHRDCVVGGSSGDVYADVV